VHPLHLALAKEYLVIETSLLMFSIISSTGDTKSVFPWHPCQTVTSNQVRAVVVYAATSVSSMQIIDAGIGLSEFLLQKVPVT